MLASISSVWKRLKHHELRNGGSNDHARASALNRFSRVPVDR
jgi:hypothetical protein